MPQSAHSFFNMKELVLDSPFSASGEDFEDFPIDCESLTHKILTAKI